MQAAFCAVYCSSSIVCTLRFVSQHKFIKIGLNNIKMLRKHNYGRSELYLKCIRILSFCFLGPSLLFKGSRAELSCVCHAMCAMPCVPCHAPMHLCTWQVWLLWEELPPFFSVFSAWEDCIELPLFEHLWSKRTWGEGVSRFGGGTRDMKKINQAGSPSLFQSVCAWSDWFKVEPPWVRPPLLATT